MRSTLCQIKRYLKLGACDHDFGSRANVPFSAFDGRAPASVRVLDDAKAVFTKTATGYTAEVRLKCDSIALKNAASGLRIRGDVGVLFSNDGGKATQTRAYLTDHSPGASITADVPSIAEIRPREWGEWILE